MPVKPFEPYSSDRIENVVERLERAAGRLRAVATWMEEEEVEQILVTNHKSLIKGLEFAEAFGYAAERAVDNHRFGIEHGVLEDDEE